MLKFLGAFPKYTYSRRAFPTCVSNCFRRLPTNADVTHYTDGTITLFTPEPVGKFSDAILIPLGTISRIRNSPVDMGESAGSVFAQGSPNMEDIYTAQKRYGRDVFSHLIGSYALVIYDPFSRQLTVGVDPLNLMPIYYFEVDEYLVLSNDLAYLVTELNLGDQINERMLLEYISGEISTSNETFCRRVRKIPRSSSLFACNARTNVITYKDYWFKNIELSDTMDDHTAANLFRRTIERAVKFGLVGKSNNGTGVMVSGGIDSSAILCLMLKNMPEISPAAYSLSFEGGRFSAINETYLVETISKVYGIEVCYVAGDMMIPMSDPAAYDEVLHVGPQVSILDCFRYGPCLKRQSKIIHLHYCRGSARKF